MKIRPVGAELFHADRRRDGRAARHTMKLIVGFRNSSNAPKTISNSSLPVSDTECLVISSRSSSSTCCGFCKHCLETSPQMIVT